MMDSEAPLTDREYAVIGAIAQLFLSDAPLERVCMACASLLAQRLDVSAVDISLYDAMAGEVAALGAAGGAGERRHTVRLPLRQSIYGDVIEQQQVVVDVNTINQDCWRRSWLAALRPAAIVLVPMRAHTIAIGALGIAECRSQAEIQHLAATAQVIADYLAQEIMRIRAELNQQKKEVFFRAMVDYQTEFVCRIAPDTTFMFVNQTYLRYLEKFQEELIGTRLIDLVDGADRAVFADQVQALHAEAQVITVEHRWTTSAGDVRWHRWILRMLHDENGRPLEILGVGNDFTEAKKTRLLEARVRCSERLASLGLLISGIAHEINNPNNFIAFNIPVLRDYLRAMLPITDEYQAAHPDFAPFGMSYPEFRDDLFKLLENMEHGSERINRTVTGLREFMSNKGAMKLVWADMQTVVDRAVMLCGSKVKNAVKSFSVAIDDAAANIYTDPHTLEHILIILLLNAAQAADKTDSFIRVAVQRGTRWQEHAIIAVSDNGCGIAPEHRDKLFEPFFTTRAASGGTGLGLHICRDMVGGLGGQIDIDSEPGAGTTVKLVLPDISSV